jgi:F-type H+-transporting ATPase subunit b
MEEIRIAFLDSSSTPFTPQDFLDKLFPNFWSFLINFLALIVLFVALYFIAYKPVKKLVDARKDYIERNLRDSEKAKAISERKAAEGDEVIAKAKTDAVTIIAKAKTDASGSALAIVSAAEKEAQERQKAADEAIKQEEEKSRRAVHDEIVSVALEASRQVLGREVKDADNDKLIHDFADSLDQKGKHE